jgi:hypothetical protein
VEEQRQRIPTTGTPGGIAHGRSETTNPANVHADDGSEGMGVGDGRAGQSSAREIPGAGRPSIFRAFAVYAAIMALAMIFFRLLSALSGVFAIDIDAHAADKPPYGRWLERH